MNRALFDIFDRKFKEEAEFLIEPQTMTDYERVRDPLLDWCEIQIAFQRWDAFHKGMAEVDRLDKAFEPPGGWPSPEDN